MNRRDLARLIDHTNLRASATIDDIKLLCDEARTYGFASVVVNPSYVMLASKELENSQVLVCCVVGFPLGAMTSTVKAFEARVAIDDGASEIDMVMNIGALKSGLLDSVETDIRAVAREVKKAGKLLKVIIEAPLLRDDEKKIACKIATAAGADFVKSCTGFADGANVADIRLMRETVGGQMGVKASGGIRSLDDAVRMIEAGANRIGTSSGVKIMEEYAKQQIDS